MPTAVTIPSATPRPAPLEFWQAVTSSITVPGEVQRWQFEALEGDAITLRVLGRGVSVNLTLETASGRILATGNDLNVFLPADGVYTVLAQLVGASVGEYELGLGYSDRPNPADVTPTPVPVTVGVPTPTPVLEDELGLVAGELLNGSILQGEFQNSEQGLVYHFEARRDDYVNILLEPLSAEVDPILNLYGPDGNWLAIDDNSGLDRTARLRNVRLPADGTYRVQALGGGFLGAYQISLLIGSNPIPVTPVIIAQPTATPPSAQLATPATVPDNAFLRDHVPVLGVIERASSFDRYAIDAHEGDVISINVRPVQGSALRPHFEVFGPGGERIAEAAAGNNNEALVIGAPIISTGVYTVFVTGEENRSTGEYVLSYGRGFSYENTIRGEALPDFGIEGALAQRGERDVWVLALNAGDDITAAVTSTDGRLDPVIEIFAPDETLLSIDDNSGGNGGALIASLKAAETGFYTLRVSGAGGATSGPYALFWRYLTVAPSPTRAPASILVMAADDVAQQQSYNFYPFQGAAGQRVRVRVTAQDASGLDPVAALLGPDGAVIVEVDDGPDSLNPEIIAQLPADGTYVVRINGYGTTSGAYDVIVELLF